MKTRFAYLIAALLAGLSVTSGATPFTYESPAELSTTLDADGDGQADLLVLDKTTGVRQLALQQSDGSFVWSDPAPTGLDTVTSLSAGRFNSSGLAEGFTVAAPTWNRVLVFPDMNSTGLTAPSVGIGPNMVAAFDFTGDTQDDLVIATQWDDPPAATHLAGVQTGDAGMSVIYPPAPEVGPLTQGNRARFKSDRTWLLGAMRPAAAGVEFITRAVVASSGLVDGPTLSGLSTNANWAWGEFAPGAYAQFLFYSPGSSVIQAPGLQEPTPQQWVWTQGNTFDLGGPIAQLFVLSQTNGAMLLVVFGDGSTAGTFDFDGTTAPVARQSFSAPAGMRFSLAGALGGGDFLLLHGANGGQGHSTGWQRWSWDGSRHGLRASGALPLIGTSSSRANVLLYGANPDTSPDAPLVQVLKAGDWSISAMLGGSALQVIQEPFLGSPLGLGAPSTINLNTATTSVFGIFPVLNQRSSNETAVLLAPPAVQPLGDLTFSPAPGTYHLATNSTLQVRITATPPAPVYYRTSTAQPWTAYDPANSPLISATTTFFAYANAAAPTPIRTALYVIADPPLIVPPSPVDANHNGLPDAWEQAFGLTDHIGDADGDGFSNLQEYQAGTDPLDPASVPSSSPSDVELIVRPPGAGAPVDALCEIVWPADVTGAVLETSTDLTTPTAWTPVSAPIFLSGNVHVYYQLTNASETSRFFRLRFQQ